jgi:hypothetical protein
MGQKRKSKKREQQQQGLGFGQTAVLQATADFSREVERRQARSEGLAYRIAPDCKVHIQFNGIATQDAIRKLIAYLQMSIEDFPQNAEEPPTIE